MENCKPISTPAGPGVKLSLHEKGEPFDIILYDQAVGCLIYLCNTRPYIQYSISQVSKFMHSPGTQHWQAVKRIFFGTFKALCILAYSTLEGGGFSLLAYSDSDWAGDYDTRQPTSGNCFFLGQSCISWLSKKQPTVATSSCEAEYRAAFTTTVECVWLCRLVEDFGIVNTNPTPILADSQSAIAIAKNPIFHARTKHIEVHYHYVREQHNAGVINLLYCSTHENVADIFTKALSREKFVTFCKCLGLFSLR